MNNTSSLSLWFADPCQHCAARDPLYTGGTVTCTHQHTLSNFEWRHGHLRRTNISANLIHFASEKVNYFWPVIYRLLNFIATAIVNCSIKHKSEVLRAATRQTNLLSGNSWIESSSQLLPVSGIDKQENLYHTKMHVYSCMPTEMHKNNNKQQAIKLHTIFYIHD